MEVADELGVNLKQGYNGNITAKKKPAPLEEKWFVR